MTIKRANGGGLGGSGSPGGALGSFYSYSVSNSMRLDGSSAYLSKSNFGSATDTAKRTFSTWIKTSNVETPASYNHIIGAGSSSIDGFGFGTSEKLQWLQGGSVTKDGNRIIRDPGAWYHVFTTWNATDNEIYIYVNGELDYSSTGSISGLSKLGNTGHTTYIGRRSNVATYIHGYLADTVFLDGTIGSISDFGETKDGVWVPKNISAAGLTFGDNGFYLDYADSSDLGKDVSGKGNHFTSNSLGAQDQVPDSPTRNYCTLTPHVSDYISQITFAEGGLKCLNSTVHKSIWSTFPITSGKWYWEGLSAGGNRFTIGLSDARNTSYTQSASTNNIVGYTPSSGYAYGDAVGLYAGTLRKNGSTVASSLGYATNDKMGIAFDADAGKVWFHRNGTWFNGSGTDSTTLDLNNHDTTVTTGEAYVPVFSLETPTTWLANFGQDGTFATGSGGGNSDDNGEGDFFYAVPSGFLALNSDNLEDVTISPGQSSQADDFFNTVLWSGNSTNSRSITTGFETDLVWIKKRGTTVQSHVLADSVRGTSDNSGTGNVGILTPNSTAAVSTNSSDSGIASFDSTGFTIGAGSNTANADAPYQGTNASGHTYVGWSWKAGGATPTKTYKVVVDNDGANKYRFRNSADDATFATYAPTVTLQEGGTYVFDWSDDGTNGAVSAQGHPIRFSTTSDGTHGGGTKYTTGVVEDDSAYTTTITVAASAPTLYYYCANHSGMGGQINTNSTFGSTNFDGSLQNVVSANKEAGFSIVTWTAPNDNGTLGHGLDSAPEWILAKPLGSGTNWYVMHTPDGVVPANEVLNLDSTAAKFNPGVNHFNDTYPTSTVFSYGGYLGDDLSNDDKVAYLWHSVEGYSKVGLYKGNANNYDDGIFVYTGFRPALVTLKSVGAGAWVVTDNKRSSAYNGATARLYWSETAVETAYNTNRNVELFSNGFMVHGNSASSNTNKVNEAQNYIYLAFAETPFKFANAR